MAFFSDLKLMRNKRGFTIKYCDKTLMQIYSKTFVNMFKDYATQKFINDISQLTSIENVDDALGDLASKLEKTYTHARRKWHNNKRIRAISKTTKEYKCFVSAARLIQLHKVDVKQYLNAQVEGLSFIGETGIFPKPTQITGNGAEERLVTFLSNTEKEEDPEKFEPKKLTFFDKETELLQNPVFVEYFGKVQDSKATLRQAQFVADCMLVRKGEVRADVKSYIKELKGK